jgi:hypothetical protein
MSANSPAGSAERGAKNVVESRAVDSLKQHPFQDKLFRDLDQFDFEQLLASLRKNGLLRPVEILSDGTILDGHQRVLAAKQLGWETIQCLVCREVEAKGEDACKQYFIEANLHRRQLTPLQTVRCYRELFGDLRKKRSKQGVLRDRLAEKFNMSGRHFDRLTKVLDAPPEIQRLCDAGQIKVELASKVSQLPAAKQSKLVVDLGKLKEGQKPNDLVKQSLQWLESKSPTGSVRNARANPNRCQLMSRVEWIVDTFKPNFRSGEIPNSCVQTTKVREAIKVLQNVLKQSTK